MAIEVPDHFWGWQGIDPFAFPMRQRCQGYFQECHVVLHPFYRKVFHDHYNFERNYELAYPLIERVTWKEVMSAIEAPDPAALARAIVLMDGTKTDIATEKLHGRLLGHCSHCDLIELDWQEDRIPLDMLILFGRFLLRHGYKSANLVTGTYPSSIREVGLVENELFGAVSDQPGHIAMFAADMTYALKLDYHDLPFSWLLSNGIPPEGILEEIGFEGFRADDRMTAAWF